MVVRWRKLKCCLGRGRRLLVGREELIRADESSVGLRGLLDLQNNLRFLFNATGRFGSKSVSPRFQ